MAIVGIVANPASGHDIRRVVTRASVFQSSEKANMVQRVLGALAAAGVARALVMPDMGGIAAAVLRATRTPIAATWPTVEFLDLDPRDDAADTTRAVTEMRARGAAAIVVLGGDGTCRLAAAAAGTTPLATLSTGTNNAYPDLREATVTGLAAGLLATGAVPVADGTRRDKLLRVRCGTRSDVALVDVAVTAHLSVGARALWEPEAISEVFATFGEPDAIGLSSIAALLAPTPRDEPAGVHVRLDALAPRRLLAPIAPGVVAEVGVVEVTRLVPDRPVTIAARTGVIALDGEREIEFGPADRPIVELSCDGPFALDVRRTLAYAAANDLLIAERARPVAAD